MNYWVCCIDFFIANAFSAFLIFYSWICFYMSDLLVLPFSKSWVDSCPKYQLNALFAMAHSTSFWQFKHSLGMGSPFGSFSRNPSIVHSELFSLATIVDFSVFVGFCPLSFGDIVKKKVRSNRNNSAIIKKMTNGDSRNGNMLLPLQRMVSTWF